MEAMPVILDTPSAGATTGAPIVKLAADTDAVEPVRQSAPLPLWKSGTTNVTFQPANAPESSTMTNGEMVVAVSCAVPFSVTFGKLPTVGSPAPLSNCGGDASARVGNAQVSSAAATSSRRSVRNRSGRI